MMTIPTAKTMTFKELRQTVDPYPAAIDDDALKATIELWFDARNVCDDNNFVTFFQRQLIQDYERYFQLLRIEAGIAEYDWLVQEYHEHKVDTTRTPNLTESTQGSATETEELEIADTRSIANAGKDTVQHSGVDTTTADYSDTTTHNTQDKSITGNPETETATTTHPTRTVTTSESTESTQQGTNGGDTVHLVKDNPMSNYYESGIAQYGFVNGDAGSSSAAVIGGTTGATTPLAWGSPSVQEETGTLNSEKSTTSGSGSGTEAEAYSGDDIVERVKTGGRERTGTETREIDGKTSEVTHGEKIETSYGKGVTETADGKHTTEKSGNSTGMKTTTGTDNSVVKDRYTGRHEAPAELLTKATMFITNTSAWKWLYKQLDVCFISILDYEYDFG